MRSEPDFKLALPVATYAFQHTAISQDLSHKRRYQSRTTAQYLNLFQGIIRI